MTNIDLLFSTRTEILGEWYVAKPLQGPLLSRIKDAWAIITGKAVAVSFTEMVEVSELLKDKMNVLQKHVDEFKSNLEDIPENVSNVLQTKYDKEIKKLGVELTRTDDMLRLYKDGIVIKYEDDKITLIEEGEIIIDDNTKMGELYTEFRFKYIHDRLVSVLVELDKNREYMLKDDEEEE